MNIKRAIGGPLLSLVFLVAFGYMIAGVQWMLENSPKYADLFIGSISGSMQNVPSVSEVKDQPAPPQINAESAISVESDLSGDDKVVFEKSSNTKMPIASLTKLMTAVIVLDNYNFSESTVVSNVADSQDKMVQDIKAGDAMTVENLFDIMLIESSNKSAYALSEVMGTQKFVDLMNQKAKDLGLKNTFFADPTGLSDQNVSTAIDLTKLAEYILKNYPKITEISRVKELYLSGFGTIANTDQLLGEIPDIVCGKTGFTTAAKGCLLLVTSNPKNNNYIINVILGADDRFSDMKNLVNWSTATCN